MTLFSIIQQSSQQQFELKMKGKVPLQQSSTGQRSREDAALQTSAEKLKDLGAALVDTTSGETDEASSEGEDILKDFQDAVDLNSTLTRAVKDNADAERDLRIDRMAQTIARMKEELKFATPEKAKRMLRELQQIAKDFRMAAIELRKAAEKIGPDLPNGAVDVAADATSLAIDRKLGPEEVPPEDLARSVEGPAAVLFNPLGQTELPGQDQTGAMAGGLGPFEDSLLPGLPAEKDATYFKDAVYAYAAAQHQSDSTYRQGRIEGMREEHDRLMQIFEEIELLAGTLETLADKEDEDVQEAFAALFEDLAEGFSLLDADDLQQFLGAGRYALPDAAGSGAVPGLSTVTVTSLTVETSVSVSVSGVVV